jgi:hypothetical protein
MNPVTIPDRLQLPRKRDSLHEFHNVILCQIKMTTITRESSLTRINMKHERRRMLILSLLLRDYESWKPKEDEPQPHLPGYAVWSPLLDVGGGI